jgi:diacylglycerol kinase (ATP)
MRKRLKSFAHAFRGIVEFVRLGANAKIQLVAAVLIVGLGLLLEFGTYDWIAVVLCIGMVLSAEAMNTAVEQLADALRPESDERIRLVKDVAAGAALITAIVSVVVAVLVIWKHLWQ